MSTPPNRWQSLRRRTMSQVLNRSWAAISAAGRVAGEPHLSQGRVSKVCDLPYATGESPHHRLDIWRPTGGGGGRPVVLYIHGGGFQALSKDTHWLMGVMFARRGFVTVNINYRLAPANPFPAAVQDVVAAWAWIQENIADFGGDPSRVIVAGESAGANLALALAIGTCTERPEPWAKPLRDLPVPALVLPTCGVFQVSDLARLGDGVPLTTRDMLLAVEDAYLCGEAPGPLADVLCTLEAGPELCRPFPPVCLDIGTADPLLGDTERMAAALSSMGIPHELQLYPGEPHAFHSLVWRPGARRCWSHIFGFIARHLPPQGIDAAA